MSVSMKKAENMFFVICIIHENNRHRSLYLHIYICSVQINSKIKLFKSVCIENRDFAVHTKRKKF